MRYLRTVRRLHFAKLLGRALSGSTATMEGQTKAKYSINVEITSDIACPWCWVGKRHLDIAMEHLKEDFEFHVRWKPFLLNPYVPEEGIPLDEYLRMKFGEEAGRRFLSGESPLIQTGKTVGIVFTPHRLVLPTKKAHLLSDYAEKEGKQHKMQEVLFRAYFADGQNITTEQVLLDLVKEVGLDEDRAMAVLQDTEAVHRYQEGVKEAQRKGITGVPNFEISLRDQPNVRQQFSGAQPIDTFVAIFSRLKVFAKV